MPGRTPVKSPVTPIKPSSISAKPDAKLMVQGLSAARHSNAGSREDRQAAKTQAPTGVQTVEPEDAYLTGVSRSLQRRLLGLNVQGSAGQAKPHPEADAAGLHATGSFAKTSSLPAKSSAKARK